MTQDTADQERRRLEAWLEVERDRSMKAMRRRIVLHDGQYKLKRDVPLGEPYVQDAPRSSEEEGIVEDDWELYAQHPTEHTLREGQ